MRWLLCFFLVTALAPPAEARPPSGRLLLFGAALAPPDYFFGVALHEGSHALVAEMFGADVTAFRVLPWRDPDSGAFYFGYVRFQGRLSKGQFATFLLAPKIVDALLLSTYGALVLSGTLPESRYGQMAMAVVATGLWVDFSKDIVAFRPHNDTVKLYRLLGHESFARQLPLRVLHAGMSATAAYIVYRGYKSVFKDDPLPPPVMIPLLSAAF